MKILVVEDERPIAKALQLKLTSCGFSVDQASNGEEGLKMIETTPYQLVLLDLVMPTMTGFEVLEQLKAKGINVPVIVSSNLSQNEDINRAKALGAVDYYIKSETPISQVVEQVRAHLLPA